MAELLDRPPRVRAVPNGQPAETDTYPATEIATELGSTIRMKRDENCFETRKDRVIERVLGRLGTLKDVQNRSSIAVPWRA